MIDYPNKLNIIFDKLDKFGIKSIIVGGYIRDKLLNLSLKCENYSQKTLTSKDIDIELYGISSLDELEKLLREFGDINSVGKSFGVCKLTYYDLDIDFSLPRTDSKVSNGHTGFTITTDKNLDFKTATSRRDFTVNAIGYDVKEKKILDPFSGVRDLNSKILRAVDLSKFDEDPLRVLRAIQFSARFDFKLEKNLFLKCKLMIQSNVLEELPNERIYEEIKKLLLKSTSPSQGFRLLKDLNGFLYFKELATLSTQEFNSTLKALDILSSYSITDLHVKNMLMLTLLCFKLTPEMSLSFLNRFTKEKSLIKEILAFKSAYLIIDIDNFNDFNLYELATRVEIQKFSHFLQAIHLGNKNKNVELLRKKAEALNILYKKSPALIEGRDLLKLGFKPSKEFSKILQETYTAQIKGTFKTHIEAIEWLKKSLLLS